MAVSVVHGAAQLPVSGPRPVVTVGNFDGVHRGHQWLLESVVGRARALGAPALVYTFDPAPRDVLQPGNEVPRIQSLDDRVACLGRVGVDVVVVERFTHQVASISPRDFAQTVLADQLRAAELVLGWDFRFGARRGGRVADLAEWINVPVTQLDAAKVGDLIVSSSRIRQLVSGGHVRQAGELLTRPHRLRGVVQRGDQRGRTLGFATANVVPDTPLRPGPGVYAVRAWVGGRALPAVANYGRRPTFGAHQPLLEVHILDWEGDIYGQPLSVDLVARIRAERKFSGPQELMAQIAIDVQKARHELAR